MARQLVFLILTYICLLSPQGWADTSPAHNDQVEAQATATSDVSFAISYSIPPWVIRDEDRGIKLDILRAALSEVGMNLKPVYLSHGKAYASFADGKVDAVLSPQTPIVEGGFLSKPVVVFHNYAISLAKKSYPENITMDFLRDKSVVAFEKAHVLLGPEFGGVVTQNAFYQEEARQHLQVNLLFVREVDFVVLDKSVFGYYWRQVNETEKPDDDRYKQPVSFHNLFPPSAYSFLFLNEQTRDLFDQGLDQIRANGTYDQIVGNYSGELDLYRPE